LTSSSKYPSPDRRRADRLAGRIKTLEDEARAIKLWLEIHEGRSNPDEKEIAAYEVHWARYQKIVKEIYRLAPPPG
jgi:hypothetical protein